MNRRSLYKTDNYPKPLNIFQSFSDLMANAFMILCLFLSLALIHAKYSNQQLVKNNESIRNLQNILEINQQLEQKLSQSLSKNKQLEERNKQLEERNERLHSAAPIIIDEASSDHTFQSGSAELKPELKEHLKENIVIRINKILKEREIDFIQVIGHTDGEGINQTSNLDKTLEIVAQGTQSVRTLSAGSNADLGLMRALAVVQELKPEFKQELEQTGLQNVEFRAYSAAQLYLPNGELAPLNRQADAERRRIEIRFIPPGNILKSDPSFSYLCLSLESPPIYCGE